MSETVSDQLAWETRAGRVAAVAAVLSALLFIGGSIYLGVALDQQPRRSDEVLGLVDREPTDFILAGALAGLALLLLGVVLAYLYRTTRFRRPQIPTAALVLIVFGAVGAAAVAVARRVELIGAAGDFLAAGAQTEERADTLLRDRTSLQVISGLGLATNLALAFGTILVSVNAMRAGLLSRFLGILGIVIGALLPLVGPMPVLLFFWLGALAALFVDRWPGGRGLAWQNGEAVPWPKMAQRRAELERERGTDPDQSDEGADEEPDGAPGGAADGSDLAGVSEAGPASGSSGNGAAAEAQRAKRERGRRG
jgi:MFS family permease